MNHLIDVNPVPNWVLLFSKFLALFKNGKAYEYNDYGIEITKQALVLRNRTPSL
jgi:hypothetical protein